MGVIISVKKFQLKTEMEIYSLRTMTKNRWKEHFETVLNRPIPPAEDIPEAERDLNIGGGEITLEEVQKAIGHSRNNKAPGEDRVFFRRCLKRKKIGCR